MHNIIHTEADKISNVIDFSKLKNKSILITGASGIIGLFLIESLKKVQKKFNIKIFAWINKDIPNYISPIFENCNIIKGDITDASKFENLPKFDVIIHSAGYGQPLKFIKNKIKTIQINTESTIKLFNILAEGGSYLFISTSELYNGLEKNNITENCIGNTNTDHFRSCYIEGKRCGESICNTYKENGVDVKIARVSLAYGPGTRNDDERAINTFIKKGIQNNSIELIDNGSAIRTYCYITDTVEMLWNILLHGKHVTYNIGGISVTSIKNLAEIIATNLGKSVKLPCNYNPLEGNPTLVNINCDRYMKEFNKTFFVSLDNGVEKTINWYKLIL